MKTELLEKLVSSYPKLFSKVKRVDCGDGWFHLLNTLCNLIEHKISQLPLEMQSQVCISQVKEKFAGLRFYMDHSTPEMEGAIDLAEDLSQTICEACGNSGQRRSLGTWLITLCDTHYENEMKIREENLKRKKS
jgi:hypothetical protein